MIISNISPLSGLIVTGQSYGPSQSGNLYWDANARKFIIQNGGHTVEMYPTTMCVGLDNMTIQTLYWARQMMEKENELAKLAENNPTVKSALNNLEVVVALCK